MKNTLTKMQWHTKRTNILLEKGIDIGPWKPPVKNQTTSTKKKKKK